MGGFLVVALAILEAHASSDWVAQPAAVALVMTVGRSSVGGQRAR
ncbi:hypothetical protein [Dactylosporangium fulvum]|uniref:Uncharacterized protein n=1 Tax=Dactylosporangium fulvum TaxID=53359 RepID=A0ABY5W0L6_9ACTN|nr:hypothetical protein [Dactylosporangium fulvum]UWP81596.1 hypothetical protein Dfulv_41840 [Dactylosporangium fulvum]